MQLGADVTIAAIFPNDFHPTADDPSWAGSFVSDVVSGDEKGTHGGGSQNTSSTTFPDVIRETISVVTRSIKASHAASCSYGVKTW